ncbi:Tyrosine-type recombinase/integrase [Sulfidibacter corallicola]|uniref:Tyrosine-type recombinase/integrase n=1 Tax=Sulfidibacter corallicola TaxID=2818388 RepID=A0A8A4TST5_SULCO|nr:tyrosine-type recombinase/integrase [Sulfidibacter corallicola]QTD52111.1 tyrosine-type recombinase/integrase [Sulfidibacter corallicola]
MFFKRMPHVTTLSDYNSDNIRAFLYEGRIKYKWKTVTFKSYFGALRGFASWCVKRKLLPENPLLDIERPKMEKTIPKSLKKDQAEALLDHVFHKKTIYRFERYRNRALFGLMIFAGLRVAEVLALKIHDVDFQENSIFVRLGKGLKDRTVPLLSRLKVYLHEYMKERERIQRTTPFFITSVNGDRPFTANGVKKVVEWLRHKSKIYFTCHGLRHTFATQMLRGGCNIYALSKFLGHSDIRTTTIYLSASADYLQKEIVKHPMNFNGTHVYS